MNGQDENLNIKITADGTAAAAGINDVAAATGALSGLLGESAVAGTRSGAAITEAHTIAAGAAVRHAEAETILGATIGKVETATNSAARAFGAFGIHSGEATERILAVTEALDGLEASAVPLIAIGAAFLAIGAAVNFAREGISDAAKEQAEFTSMQSSVTAQRGNWDEARESIEKFATALEGATTFSRGEAIQAIDSLTSAGRSYSDAEKLVAIATDVAAAKHLPLIQVTDELLHAQGRGAGQLVVLDGNLKKVIASHGKLSEVARILAHDFASQASAATETLSGKEARLRNELETLGTEIGTALLPMLERAADFFIGMAKAAETAASAARDTIAAIGDAGAVARDFFTNRGAITKDISKFNADNNRGGDETRKALGQFNDPWSAAKPDRDAWRNLRKNLDSRPFDNDSTVGADPKAKGSKGGKAGRADPTPVHFDLIGDDDAAKTDAVVKAQKRLNAQLKTTSASEDAFKLAVELATTSEGKARAEAALRTKTSEDAAEASVRLGRQIAAERAEIAQLTPQQTAATASAHALAREHDSLATALMAAQDRSASARLRVEELAKQHTAAAKTASELASTISTLTSNLNANSDALQRQPALVEANARAQAALMLAYNDSRDAEREKLAEQLGTNGKSLEDERAYWQSRIDTLDKGSADYLKRLADFENRRDETGGKITERNAKYDTDQASANQKIADEEATYKVSLGRQLTYYQARYAAAVAADGQYSDEAKKYAEQIRTLEADEYKQRADQAAAFTATVMAEEGKITDDVLSKHKNMRDELKSVWGDIVSGWTKSLEEMVLKSSVLGKLNGMLFPGMSQGGAGGGGGGGAQTAGGIAGGSGIGGMFSGLLGGGGSAAAGGGSAVVGASSAGASQYGILGAFLGTTGAQSTINSLPTNQGATGLLLGSSAAQDAQSGIAGYGQDTTAGSIPAGAGGGSGGGSFLKNGIGGAVEGAALSGIGTAITGGNSTNGMFGGALGGIIGAATHANPLIGAGIDVAMSLIGSLFGPKNNAYTSPDTKDTTNYGSTIAALLGHAGANGQTFYEDSSTKSLFGGQTALAGLEELAANGQAAFSKSTGLSAANFQQLVSEVGSSATGSGTLGFGKNIGDLKVSGASGAGGTFRYTDFQKLLQQIETGLGANGGSAAIPTFSLTRQYGDPNATTLASTGTYTPTAQALGGVGTSTQAGVTVNLQGATIVGPGGLAGVAQDIGTALGRLNAGQLPGGYTPSLSRFNGGS